MTTVLEELVAKLGIDVDQQRFIKAASMAELVAQGVSKIGAAAIDATKHLFGLVPAAAEYADEIDKAAKRTGLSVEEVQRLGYAAELSDASLSSVTTTIGILATNAGNALGGSKDLTAAFRKLGISAGDLKALGTEELFLRIAAGLEKLPEGVAKVDLARAVLGRGGQELMPFLAQGSASIRALMGEAEILTEEQIKAGAQLDELGKRIKRSWADAERSIGGALLPSAIELYESFLKASKAAQKLVGPKVQKGIGAAVKGLRWLLENVWAIRAALIAVSGTMLAVHLPAITAAVAAAWAWAAALNAASIAAWWAGVRSGAAGLLATAGWAALFILLGLLAEDFYQFFTGGDSLIGRFLAGNGAKFTAWMDDLLRDAPGDSWWLAVLKDQLRGLLDVQGAWERGLRNIHNLWAGIVGAIREAASLLKVTAQAMSLDPAAVIRHIVGGGQSAAAARALEAVSWLSARPNAMFGDGALSPAASVSGIASSGGSVTVNAPVTQTIHAAPGQSPTEVGDAAAGGATDWWDRTLREAVPALVPLRSGN